MHGGDKPMRGVRVFGVLQEANNSTTHNQPAALDT
jgi:hypothetical protein